MRLLDDIHTIALSLRQIATAIAGSPATLQKVEQSLADKKWNAINESPSTKDDPFILSEYDPLKHWQWEQEEDLKNQGRDQSDLEDFPPPTLLK